jgi:hypothetical protein
MLVDNFDFVIGMDLFARFGFGIAGIMTPRDAAFSNFYLFFYFSDFLIFNFLLPADYHDDLAAVC